MNLQKKLISLVLCVMMVLTVLPVKASAQGYDSCDKIQLVNLTGAKDIITAGKVAEYAKAVDISTVDTRFTIKNVYCREAFDGSYLYKEDPLMPGVEYKLSISLVPTAGYTFPYDWKDMTVTMDGVPVDAENFYSYYSGSNGVWGLTVTIPFTMPGTTVEYVDGVDLLIKQHPVFGASAFSDDVVCELPLDAPYRLVSAEWRYETPNRAWSLSENFTEKDKFCLWVVLEAKEGENIRFSDQRHMKVSVSGLDTYTELTALRRADGTCKISIYCDVELPESYVISYDPCGGAFPDGSTGIAVAKTRVNGTVSSIWTDMRKAGYNFAGWFTMPEGGEKLADATTFSAPATLYAHWEPCIDEVHIDNIMLPQGGNAPVFTAKVPDGAGYKISLQEWSDNDKYDPKMISSSAVQNNMILEYGEEFLLRTFDGSKVYVYSITLNTTNGTEFGRHTTVYLNGKPIEVQCYSDTLILDRSFDCAVPKTIEVCDGAAIISGLCGSAIEELDLRNYVRSRTDCTFAVSGDKPSWINLSSDGRLSGTRPDTAKEECTFYVSVSDGNTIETMEILVGAVTAEWEFIMNPESCNLNDCTKYACFMVETSANNPTYEWEMNVPGYSWYPVETVAMMSRLYVEASDGLLIVGTTDENPVDLNGCRFRCNVTVDGVTKTSDAAKLTVNHDYTNCCPTTGSESETHIYTCRDCGVTKEEDHLFYYLKVSDSTYGKVCAICHKYGTQGYTDDGSSTVILKLDFNGADVPSGTHISIVDQYDTVRPYKFYPVRDGFIFEGWAMTKDATEAVYGPDDEVFTAKDITLYAVWKPLELVVNGTAVTRDNMGDILGDGTVYLMPATNTHISILVLNGASLETKYISAIEEYAAIYTKNPIEILMIGSNSTIKAIGNSSVGIISTADLRLSGTSLTIGSVSTYASGIRAPYTEIGVGSLTINNAGCGVDGDVMFFDGCSYFSAGAYKDDDYMPVSGCPTIYELFQARVMATNTDGGNYTEKGLGEASCMRNMKIEPQSLKEGEKLKASYERADDTHVTVSLSDPYLASCILVTEYDANGKMTACYYQEVSAADSYNFTLSGANADIKFFVLDDKLNSLCEAGYITY